MTNLSLEITKSIIDAIIDLSHTALLAYGLRLLYLYLIARLRCYGPEPERRMPDELPDTDASFTLRPGPPEPPANTVI